MVAIVEQKSQLAKLLATENLIIEHKKIQTAGFDPKNRVLYCPIWKDMTGSVYDLLMGHEVGHALYTPPEGWHDNVSKRGANFKGFLNVVEDARIEKKIKRKYPGLKHQFVKGHKYLIENDFFGIKGRDINTLSFIDRLNIHTKIGDLLPIEFTAEEQKLYDDVVACETWEDVLRVTEAVFDYSKNEQFDNLQKMLQSHGANSDDEFEEAETTESSDADDDGEQSVGEKRESKSKGENGEQEESTESKTDGESDDYGDESGSEINHDKDSSPSTYDQFQPECETDKNFRQKEDGLLDESCKPFVYAKLPTPILENIVTPAKVVHDHLYNYYFGVDIEYYNEKINSLVSNFKSKNDSYIALLAKEFEMKKAARAYAKSKVSNTGDIDINKLYKYQVEDNIFKKMMRVPKGKSHGLVLLLDRSGSMSNNMANSIEQIMVLAMFCRRVNIPYVVYGFGDSIDGRMRDFPNHKREYSFTQNVGEIHMSDVYLREYLNSRMTTSEFNRAFRNMLMLKESYANRRMFGRPLNEDLSNTPLIQAMVALEPITKEFRKVNHLDLVNLVVVHDGDADRVNAVIGESVAYGEDEKNPDAKKYKRNFPFDPMAENVYVRDGKEQFKIESVPHDYYQTNDGMRVAIFNWFARKTGSKIFGFFIAGERQRLAQSVTYRYVSKDGKSIYKMVNQNSPVSRYQRYEKTDVVKSICAEIREKKFIQSYNLGYNSFFILPGGDELGIENEELVVSGNFTANKLKNAFMKMTKKRQFNRVMVSRFIDGIAV